MDDAHGFADLDALMKDALSRAGGDARKVWSVPALGFESKLSTRAGHLVGGLWSPAYLQLEGGEAWSMGLEGAVAVPVDSAREPLGDWLPLLESAAAAKKSLLFLVAGEVDEVLLRTLIVNHRKHALSNAVLHANGAANAFARPRKQPPPDLAGLTEIRTVWCRRDASVCFPREGAKWPVSLATVQVLEVGGDNDADQMRRFAYVARALARRD